MPGIHHRSQESYDSPNEAHLNNISGLIVFVQHVLLSLLPQTRLVTGSGGNHWGSGRPKCFTDTKQYLETFQSLPVQIMTLGPLSDILTAHTLPGIHFHKCDTSGLFCPSGILAFSHRIHTNS